MHVRAPGRVNLIGDHTDYTGGLVFPMAIDRYTTITYEHTGNSVHLTSHDEPGVVDVDLDAAFDHAMEPRWGRYVAAVASLMDAPLAVRGTIETTIPVGAGLSSSAALEISCALAMGATLAPRELAQMTQRAEQLATGVPTGIMDQLCIASASEGHGTLIDCHTLEITHIPIPDEVDIVVQFIAHRTLEGSEYATRVAECATAESLIGPLRDADISQVDNIADDIIRARARHVVSENERVRHFTDALVRGHYTAAGRLMVGSHQSLARDYATSNPQMDAAVDAAVNTPGVFGARMTGGGFGGCIVALCTPESSLPGWRVRPTGAASHL